MTRELAITVIMDVLQVERDAVVPEARIVEDLGADSLDSVKLAMVLEAAIGTRLDDVEAQNMRRVSDVFAFVDRATPEIPTI
jgi:acyl carrier protein